MNEGGSGVWSGFCIYSRCMLMLVVNKASFSILVSSNE